SLGDPGQVTWYDYPGKTPNCTWQAGDSPIPSLVARILPDNTLWYAQTFYSQYGLPDNWTGTYTAPSGEVATRTGRWAYDYPNGSENCVENGTNDLGTIIWACPMLSSLTGPEEETLLRLTGVSYLTNVTVRTVGTTNYTFTTVRPCPL